MIINFKHKGLEIFFKTCNTKGINPEHAVKIRRILEQLRRAKEIRDMDAPGYKLHQLKGDRQDIWAVTVRANWRITFKFENGDASILDYEDYH